ncbi:MAG TPA: STAS domain-containing protein [Candidatus Aquicultor sp.]
MQEKKLSDLTVKRAVVNNVHMIIASGECDLFSVPLLKDEMTEVINEGHKKLIVDVKSLKYIDSSGLAAILWARHKIEETGGSLVMISNTERLGRMLRPIGNLLSVTSSIKEALKLLNKRSLSSA